MRTSFRDFGVAANGTENEGKLIGSAESLLDLQAKSTAFTLRKDQQLQVIGIKFRVPIP